MSQREHDAMGIKSHKPPQSNPTKQHPYHHLVPGRNQVGQMIKRAVKIILFYSIIYSKKKIKIIIIIIEKEREKGKDISQF